MSIIRSAIAGILALFAVTSAGAQTYSPVPNHTVIGRIGKTGDSGPSQAIPFATLAAQLSNSLNPLTFGTHLTGGSYNGSLSVTLGTDATSLNTPSTIVARDPSGNTAVGALTATSVAASLASATGLPLSTGISGFGSGVPAALAIAVGSVGSPVVVGGALGTPTAGALTNLSGLPLATGVTGTLQAAQEPAHTGDVTNTAGSLALAYTNVVPAAKGGAGTINGVLSGNGSGVVSQGATTGLSDTTTDTAWTPTDASGAGLTFTSVTARYTKIGKAVTAIVRLTYPTTANTSSAAIGGLPVATSPNYPASGGVTAGSCFFTGTPNAILAPLIISSSTSLVALANNAGALALNSTLSAQTLLCTFTYIST